MQSPFQPKPMPWRKLTVFLAVIIVSALAGCFSKHAKAADDSLLQPTPRMPVEHWTFPLKIAPTGRYLVDQQGQRFLINGDAGWSSIVALTPEEATEYLTTRKQQGFNTIIISLIEHYYAGGENKFGPPFNRAGVAPFTTSGDFSKPDERYFAHADFVLKKAAELNLAVFLVPCYLGFPEKTEGWYDEMKKAGVDKLRAYGEFVGQRYGEYKNIIWVAGGDRDPDEVRPQVDAMVEGIRKFAPTALWTAHCLHEHSGAEVYGDTDWLTINSTYSYTSIPEKCLADYTHKPVRPNILLETHYENDWDYKNADDTRHQSWVAALSGTCGQFFGNRPVWLFDPGWQNGLSSPGTRYQIILNHCVRSRRWETLVPEFSSGLLHAGLGEGPDRKAAALAADGSFAVVYLPTGGPATIDLSRLHAMPAHVWWFNPRDGTSIDGGLHSVAQTETFTAPTKADWVLVIDDGSSNLPAPGVSAIGQAE